MNSSSASIEPTSSNDTRTESLAKWIVELEYKDISAEAVQRTKELFVDWLGCTIAGSDYPAISSIMKFVAQMGPRSGGSELADTSSMASTSPAFASLANGAASHVVEQDDLHNHSMVHPVSHFLPRKDLTSCSETARQPSFSRSLWRSLRAKDWMAKHLLSHV